MYYCNFSVTPNKKKKEKERVNGIPEAVENERTRQGNIKHVD